jgi:hypothetical protein
MEILVLIFWILAYFLIFLIDQKSHDDHSFPNLHEQNIDEIMSLCRRVFEKRLSSSSHMEIEKVCF